MAKSSTLLTGIEIEPSSINVAVVSTGGRLTVTHAAVAPLEPGVVRDGEVQDVEALSQALRDVFADHKSLDKRVRIGIANQKIVVRVIELPQIADAKQLESAVRFEAQEEIPMPLESAVLDFQPLDVVDTPTGPRQRIALVAARRDMIERILAAVRGAGLRPEAIDLAAFGMVRALHHHAAPDETVVYLAIGGLTNLAVAQGTTCHFTRVAGGGLDALAVELAERRTLTLEVARHWLHVVGLEQPVEQINHHDTAPDVVEDARAVLADGVRRIAGDVRNTVDFHHTQDSGDAVSRCVVTGPAASIPGFAAALSAELGLAVDAGVVDVPPGLDGASLTVAAGLALSEARAA